MMEFDEEQGIYIGFSKEGWKIGIEKKDIDEIIKGFLSKGEPVPSYIFDANYWFTQKESPAFRLVSGGYIYALKEEEEERRKREQRDS